MTSPSDQLLAEQVRQGDEKAFVHLIRHYERTLVELIRYRVGSDDPVQDVLQETLVQVWSGLRRDTPRDVRAWLLQVARNRCRDYFRSTQRRELFVETEALAWPKPGSEKPPRPSSRPWRKCPPASGLLCGPFTWTA